MKKYAGYEFGKVVILNLKRDDLLLDHDEMMAVNRVRNAFGSLKPEEAAEKVLDLFARTSDNGEFVRMAEKIRFS